MLIIMPGNLILLNKTVQLFNKQNLKIFNLSSMNENVERVAILPPTNIFQICLTHDIDSYYSDYIFNTNSIFYEFMSKIIMPLYLQETVILLTTIDDGPFNIVTESLLKIIQTRYGYNGIIINDIYDLEELQQIMLFGKESEFSLPGLAMLDIDKERYAYITSDLAGGNI